MANFSLNLGSSIGLSTDVLSGSIVFSRDGQFGRVQTFSDRLDIETTVSTDGTLPNSLPLNKYYDEVLENGDPGPPAVPKWTPALSNSDTKYNDVYVRYVPDPESAKWKTLDGTGTASPRGYREFKAQLVKLSTDNDEQSAYGFVNEGGAEWKRLREAGFSNISIDNNSSAPSCKFDGTASTIDTYKADEKVLTVGIKGFTRVVVESIQNIPALTVTDVSPFACVFRDIYKDQRVKNSYRNDPDNSVTNGTGQDDAVPMLTWASNTAERFRQKNYTLELLLDGDFEILDGATNRPIVQGDILGSLTSMVSNLGAAADEELVINLPVLSVQYDPEADNTRITVGKT